MIVNYRLLILEDAPTATLFMVEVIAVKAFTCLITAIIGLIKAQRKYRHPILTLLKWINVADGAVALLLTQISILSLIENSRVASRSSGHLGYLISICIFVIGIVYLKKGLSYER